MQMTLKKPRYATHVRWASIALIAVSLLALIRLLPIDQGFALLRTSVADLGVWGPAVFGLVYIVAALLFIPGSALTLTAGAMFGLGLGTAVVSVASTIAAALGFLIARYVARDAIAGRARQNAKFFAIDEAIRIGDWKIVAMLRLSPALPYSLSNYLYGLTPVRFWPYVAASWIAMLPGTFMYVYLGLVGSAGLSAAAQGDGGRSAGQWGILVVGLAATIAVTVYVTSLARKALKQYAPPSAEAADAPAEVAPGSTATAGPARVSVGTVVTATLAVVMSAVAAVAYANPSVVRGLFGPPQVELQEAYADSIDGVTFDHGAYDALLRAHVDADGWVDYAGLKADGAQLDAYLAAVAAAPFDDLGRNEKLALLINVYNAGTLRLILDFYPIASIKDIPGSKRWDHVRWQVAGNTWSLNQIEHEHVRAKFSDPRAHFALNCASVGCPPLRNEAYTGARIEEQLDAQSRYVHAHDRWLRYDPQAHTVHLTRLYDWYGNDFAQAAGSPIEFAARYAPELQQAIDEGASPAVRFLPYSWALNVPPAE